MITIISNPLEQEIIKNFVKKHKQERLIWELDTPRKREDVFWNFLHPDIFREECLYPVDYMPRDEMIENLYHLGKNHNIYYISRNYMGKLSLNEAAERASNFEICIIYCGNGIAYYQGEQEYGSPPRFLLLNNSEIISSLTKKF